MLSYSRNFLRSVDPSGYRKKDRRQPRAASPYLARRNDRLNKHYTYDECTTASHGLTHGSVLLEYKDRVGYPDIIDSEDSFIRSQVGKPLLNATIAVGRELIVNFNKPAVALFHPLSSWDVLVAKWFKDTTGPDFSPPCSLHRLNRVTRI